MKLHSPALQRAMHRAARRAVRARPDLRREYRRARRPRTRIPAVAFRPLLALWLAIVISGVVGSGGSVDLALCVVAIWGTGLAFVQALQIIATPYRSADLAPLSQLRTYDRRAGGPREHYP